jgi:SWI/SNF-related matrix-associated actin-dependent regulator 1 of chromatin subfamily A
VAILSITACATGLTLTKAATVVFAELHFTPSTMIQAEDRAHRIGQDAGCVNIHYLVGEDTLDVLLFRKLNEKQNIVSTTLDNKSKDLNVTKIKEQVGDFINMNGKQISVDERKNITQVVDKSNATIISYLSSKNGNNINEVDNNINMEEKENNNDIDINNEEIIKNINLHETNRRRSSLKEEEEKKVNDVNKEKNKRKKKGKKKDKNTSKNMNNYVDEKEKENKSENNNINEENKIFEDNQIIEGMAKDKFFEEEKEIENIYGDEIKSENDKLLEDKVLLDIFDINKL